MTDFTIETRTVCRQNREYSQVVVGSKGDEYRVTFSEVNPGEYTANWHCPCTGFGFRSNCKHVEAAKAKKCDAGWEAYAGGSGLGDVDKCPKCGGPVMRIQVAV